MKPHLIPALFAILSIAAGCSGSNADNSAQAIADSLRADSIMRLKADSAARVLADSLRADSLRLDSLRADSILVANALRFDDFFRTGGSTIAFLNESTILCNLKAKGFETVSTKQLRASYDPSGPDGTNFPMTTNYYMADGPDSLATTTTLSMLNSEGSRPITINFASDRQRDMFISSLKDNGFSADHTGTLTHSSNTSWAGATATESGRRVILEWLWSY